MKSKSKILFFLGSIVLMVGILNTIDTPGVVYITKIFTGIAIILISLDGRGKKK